MDFVLAVLVFVCCLAYDYAAVCWVGARQRRAAHAAATWSGFQALAACVVTIEFVRCPWLVVVTVAGHYAGTFIAVRSGR